MEVMMPLGRLPPHCHCKISKKAREKILEIKRREMQQEKKGKADESFKGH